MRVANVKTVADLRAIASGSRAWAQRSRMPSPAPGRWTRAALGSCLAELSGGAGAPSLTLACRLVREVQQQGEPVAWVTRPGSVFYPPDLADGGIDLAALPVIRLDDAAYGVTISRTLEVGTGREVAIGSVYAALERLQEKGLVSSRLGEPTPERGGRAKRYFRVTPDGVREARSTREALSVLWEGLPQLEGGRA